MSVLNRLLLISICLVLGVSLSGCATGPGREGSEGSNYRTVRVSPDRDTETATRHHQRGLEKLAEGDLEEAEQAFRKALEADVEFGPAHNNLGKVLFAKRDFYQAAWEFEYARELMPDRAEPLNNLGLVYEQSGELDRAVESYRAALFLKPDHAEFRANLARVLYVRGDRDEELVGLLRLVLEEDSRPAWKLWAREVLATMVD